MHQPCSRCAVVKSVVVAIESPLQLIASRRLWSFELTVLCIGVVYYERSSEKRSGGRFELCIHLDDPTCCGRS